MNNLEQTLYNALKKEKETLYYINEETFYNEKLALQNITGTLGHIHAAQYSTYKKNGYWQLERIDLVESWEPDTNGEEKMHILTRMTVNSFNGESFKDFWSKFNSTEHSIVDCVC